MLKKYGYDLLEPRGESKPGRKVPLTTNPMAKRLHDPCAHRWGPKHIGLRNVFGVMPYRAGLEDVQVCDVVHLNLATYLDPHVPAERRMQALTQAHWLQGVHVSLEAVNGDYLYNMDKADGTHPWAEKVFRGVVAGKGNQQPVIGVLHPEMPGWLQFPNLADEGVELRTIADLKGHIGQISPEDVTAHNQQWKETGHYEVAGQRFV